MNTYIIRVIRFIIVNTYIVIFKNKYKYSITLIICYIVNIVLQMYCKIYSLIFTIK